MVAKLTNKIQGEIADISKDMGLNAEQKKEFRDAVEKEYARIQVPVGEPVGVVAAQSIGEKGTQATLRTFHFAGVAEFQISAGFLNVMEIFDGKKIRSRQSMEIRLTGEYAEKEEKAREAATELEMCVLSQISKIRSDFSQRKIYVELDAEKLKNKKIDKDTIVKALKKVSRTTVNDREGYLELKPSISTLKGFSRVVKRIDSVPVKGVSGIDLALVFKDEYGWYIKTSGSNLAEVIGQSFVDDGYTKTNNVFEVYNVFGIEAARAAMVEEILQGMKDLNMSVDVRHVMLVVDMMTVDGGIKPIGRYGLSGQKSSVLTRASFEETTKHLLNAAARHETDKFTGVTENIMVGQPIVAGTGVVRLAVKQKKE